jgi:hypothetical protein
MRTQELEELLDLIEPFIEIQEAHYSLLTESRKEIVHAFRRLRPRKTPLPTEEITNKPKRRTAKPAAPTITTTPVSAPPVSAEKISIEQLEKDSEALLDNMGI